MSVEVQDDICLSFFQNYITCVQGCPFVMLNNNIMADLSNHPLKYGDVIQLNRNFLRYHFYSTSVL